MQVRSQLTVALAILLSGATALAQEDSERLEAIELRVTKAVSDTLTQRIASELTGHRRYLQELDDKLYERFRVWFPALSGLLALMIGIFLWSVGRTRKEAFESTRLEAVAAATALAERKVREIVVPDEIVGAAKAAAADAVAQVQELRTQLTDEVSRELKAARDEVLENKHDVIVKTLDAAVRERFSKDLDVVQRLEDIERKTKSLRSSLETMTSLIGRLITLQTSTVPKTSMGILESTIHALLTFLRGKN